MVKTEKEFQNLPKLRWKIDVDKTIIAIPILNRFIGDFLYFHGQNTLGIYYQHGSRRLESYKRMLGNNITEILAGDTEGIILFKPKMINDIPRIFFKGRRGGHGENFRRNNTVSST
jgi:hypothetical protein